MKSNIIFSVLSSVIFGPLLMGCGNGKVQGKSTIDSSLYMNDNIQYGDSVSELVAKGIVTPFSERSDEYSLNDNRYMGVPVGDATAKVEKGKVIALKYYLESVSKDSA